MDPPTLPAEACDRIIRLATTLRLKTSGTITMSSIRRLGAGPPAVAQADPSWVLIAKGVFDDLRTSFPALEMLDGTSPDGEPELEIPEQRGSRFRIFLCLYYDSLNWSVDESGAEYFPCADPDVVEKYTEAVKGLLQGRMRIVQHFRKGRFVKGFLQQPRGPGWQTVYSHYRGFVLPWLRTERRVLQNTPS